MSSSIFLGVEHNPISVEQAFHHLDNAGLLYTVLLVILRQHMANQTLCVRPHTTQEYSLQPLKERVSQSMLQRYFHQHQHEFDQVELSCIAVDDAASAQQLYDQIEQGTSFDDLASIYAVAKGQRQRLSWWALRHELKEAIASTLLGNGTPGNGTPGNGTPGNVIPGNVMRPIEINHCWYLIRVEAFLPATLDGELEQQLRRELFEQWLSETVETLAAQLSCSTI